MAEARYDPPRPIGRWMIEATCPQCGGILGHVADGRSSIQEARAVACCTACGRMWKAQVTLLDVTRDVRARITSHVCPPDGACAYCRRKGAA